MNKKLAVLIFCAAGALLAQGPGRRMGPGGGRGMMGGAAGRTVTGAPYSAVEVRETSQTLPNGNVISRKTETTIYRDGMGRVRTETTVQPRARGGQAAAQTAHTIATIHDPVGRVTRELNSATKTSRETRMPPQHGRGGNAEPRTARAGRGAASGATTTGTTTSNPDVATETLAMQTINGVQATGTRVTRTIPAGRMGNAQAIQIVHETWISPDLKVPVMIKDSDPRSGTHITQLTNITRSEPDPALFQAPSDYKVIEVRQGRGGRGR